MIADLDLNPFSLLTRGLTWSLVTMTNGFGTFGILRNIGAFGLAIVALTVILRTLLFPAFAWQLRTTKRSQSSAAKLAPQMSELRKKYKGQPQKLSAEMSKLHREHGVNPAASAIGCIPMLLQSALIYPLYSAIRDASQSTRHDLGFLWVSNVNDTVKQACCLTSTDSNGTQHFTGLISGFVGHPAALLLPLLAAGATFLTSRLMTPPPIPNATAQQKSMNDMGRKMTFLAPVMIFIFGINFIQGIAIYWVTQSSYMVAQQFYLFVVKDYHALGGPDAQAPDWVHVSRRLLGMEPSKATQREKPVSFAPAAAVVAAVPVSAKSGDKPDATLGGEAASNDAAPTRKRVTAPPSGSPSRMNNGGTSRKKRR